MPIARLNPSASLVLTGFMGTGKTTVGQIIAARLGREFVDMDAAIQAREGQSVRAIFEQRGEAYFRARESELCAELAARDSLVIATGGGALVNSLPRVQFARALVVCLDAPLDTVLARLDHAEDRPLLARAPALFKARRAAYADIEHHIDTAGKSAAQVAAEIIALWKEVTSGNRK